MLYILAQRDIRIPRTVCQYRKNDKDANRVRGQASCVGLAGGRGGCNLLCSSGSCDMHTFPNRPFEHPKPLLYVLLPLHPLLFEF